MADVTPVDYIWKNGEAVPWEQATTHVLTHALHYGSGVFEGIRCYYNEESGESVIFRLRDHMERLHRSAKIAMIDLPYTVDELCDATVDIIKKNNIKSCYIRPLAYYGYGQMGVARVDDEQQLRDALPAAFAVDERVMICELVEGVRMCVAVLGDAQDPYALPAVEVVPTASGEADFFAPVRLESLSHDETMAQVIRSEVERAAVEASAVLGCCDYSCVEIVWDGARAKVMRVDPNPSLGEGSVFLKGCQVAGISRDALLAELIDQALARG